MEKPYVQSIHQKCCLATEICPGASNLATLRCVKAIPQGFDSLLIKVFCTNQKPFSHSAYQNGIAIGGI